MKHRFTILLLGLVFGLGGAWSDDLQTTAVRFSVVPFRFAISSAPDPEVFQVSEVRILANFNNWGNGGFDLKRVWEGSQPLVLNPETGAYEADVVLDRGFAAEFTFVLKATGSQGGSWQGWYDPYKMRTQTGAFYFSPICAFVDNGVGNGGHNGRFIVP